MTTIMNVLVSTYMRSNLEIVDFAELPEPGRITRKLEASLPTSEMSLSSCCIFC
jgi:hypothetical protein